MCLFACTDNYLHLSSEWAALMFLDCLLIQIRWCFKKTTDNPGLSLVVVKYTSLYVCMSVSECVQELHTLVLQCTLMNRVFLQETAQPTRIYIPVF